MALAALVLFVLSASIGADPDACGFDRAAVLGAEAEARVCGGERAIEIAARDPQGRTSFAWYDDARGQGIELQRAPRLVAWERPSEGACRIVVVGLDDPSCPGAPPAPPHVPR